MAGLPGVPRGLKRWQERLALRLRPGERVEAPAWVAAVLVVLTGVLPSGERPLPEKLAGELAGLKAQVFSLDLAPGQYFEADLETVSGYAATRILDPAGRVVLQAETSELLGPRARLAFLAGSAGPHRLFLHSRGRPGQRCRYRLFSGRPRRPTGRDRTRDQVFRVLEEAGRTLDAGSTPSREPLQRALQASVAAEDRVWQTQIEIRLAQAAARGREPGEAIEGFARAAALAGQLGAPAQQASLLRAAGNRAFSGLRFSQAKDLFAAALGAAERSGDRLLQTGILNELAASCHQLQALEDTLRFYRRAVELARQTGDREGLRLSLGSLATAHHSMGQPKQALELFKQAEALSPRAEPRIVCEKGKAFLQLEDWPEADKHLSHCLRLRREGTDRARECHALNLMGNFYAALERPRQAIPLYEEARQKGAAEDKTCLGDAWANLGRMSLLLHRPEEAVARFRQAREVLKYPLAQAWLDIDEARAELQAGRCEPAPRLVDKAGVKLEELRADPERPASRREILGLLNSIHAARVSIVMACRKADPEAVVRGFELADAARARTLLDELREMSDARSLEGEKLLTSAADPFPLREIQARLLDADTQLLFFFLAPSKSYLWLVSHDAPVASVELPGRVELGRLARNLHGVWAARPRSKEAGEREATDLSRLLLGKIAPRLRGRRLLVVSDGELQKIPFAALPDPRHRGERLLDRHEVVQLPSASFLLHLRARRQNHPARPRGLFLLADPRFRPPDPLVEPDSFDPLPIPHTRVEAKEILALVGADAVPVFGPEATLARATSEDLGRFAVLHFATHGVLDLGNPRLSGLELARYDEGGRRLSDATLYAGRIQQMRLNAELVVLSACKTAIGPLIAGEGMIGLSRAFFNAGAARVVVSLWNVEDDSTARLMPLFYRALAEGASPSAALREAQNRLRRTPGYEHPYHWAAFIHEGEWLPLNNSIH